MTTDTLLGAADEIRLARTIEAGLLAGDLISRADYAFASDAELLQIEGRVGMLPNNESALFGEGNSPVGGHHGHVRLGQEPLLQQLAAKYQASPHRIALAWLLHKGWHILPIPGASRVASIRDSLQAMDLNLGAEDIAALDQLAEQ